ncbi:bacterial regulatory helix-turn-helix s, AraC family protein [Vibrio harveyi]|uniref:Bacterial regulatory helix-turn-helix s, AraC family protein n=1 Tax=Vibrio harveyi TaxID=669 RepID=A0A454D3Q6_VIBHA|nr:bacterial regulatory helix-turn-helix s, AraC family protein [Vibrio harveyi]
MTCGEIHCRTRLIAINIALTAHELGFNDQSHFTRAFKNHFGMTSGQFVKQQES